jgi:hypothetical protein
MLRFSSCTLILVHDLCVLEFLKLFPRLYVIRRQVRIMLLEVPEEENLNHGEHCIPDKLDAKCLPEV